MPTILNNAILAFLLLFLLPTYTVSATDFTQSRQDYINAKKALDRKDIKTYARLRAKLNNYPLSIYLDYRTQQNAIVNMSGSKASKALTKFEKTPLYNNLRHRYLLKAGANNRWHDFLAISPNVPNNISLQCYYYFAQYAVGDKNKAWKGAKKIWLYGNSRPKACDALFYAWNKSGGLTSDTNWHRMLLAFENNNTNLLTYLSKKMPTNSLATKTLLNVYKRPSVLSDTKTYLRRGTDYSDIVTVGLKKLAKQDIDLAITLYEKYKKANRFYANQSNEVQTHIVKRGLVHRINSTKSYIDSSLPSLKNDYLIELRLRWALFDKQDDYVKKLISMLSSEKQKDPRWMYWAAITDKSRANSLFKSLSTQRNFYGFWAAKKLNKPLTVADKPTAADPALQQQLAKDINISRIKELIAIDKNFDAHREWNYLLGRQNNNMRAQLGVYAQKQGWHDLAISATIRGKLWNDMKMRFPDAETKALSNASKKLKLNINEIRSISRRESAFNPIATSGAGARGLMQLMPATASHTAREFKLPYSGKNSLYDPLINVPLGSAYYNKMLKQFNQNRVLATASYNAGPNKVKEWLRKAGGTLDVMRFIDTLTYGETREYVQAVFTYRQIYEQRQNKSLPVFSKAEATFKY